MAKKGFTLIELIIVIAIIAILAGAIFVAIDPARRLHESRNARRRTDISTILDAIKTYQADHAGTHYFNISTLTVDLNYQIGTSSGSCSIDCGDTIIQSQCVDLTDIGTNYMSIIPKDPTDGTNATTGYAMRKDAQGAITVIACKTEGEGMGGTGVIPTIVTSR